MRSSTHGKSTRHTVLFCVLGTSPAVLTETVWGLVSGHSAIVPDELVVLTTTTGRDALHQALFAPATPVWDQLRDGLRSRGLDVAGKLRFGMAQGHVRLFPNAQGDGDLEDIATSDDNAVAADFMLRELRGWTEDPSTQVLASLAGGRKTMSALLLSCMGLLGRSQDRVLHVLVNPPFDGPLDPPFFYPQEGLLHRPKSGAPVRSNDARIELIDVPFVRMRGWYEDKFKSAPPSYADLVAAVQRRAPPPEKPPRLTLDRAKGRLLIEGGDFVPLTAVEFAAVCLQLEGVWSHADMAEHLLALKTTRLGGVAPEWLHSFQESSRYLDPRGGPLDLSAAIEALRKTLSSARAKLARHPQLAPHAERLLPKRQAATDYRTLRLVGPTISRLKSQI